MTEDGKQETKILEGDDALDLWRKGRDAWNRWVDENPGIDISFAGVDFSTERDAEGNLSFSGYHFGNCNTSFYKTNFGNGYVDFFGTIFRKGNVSFDSATFRGEVFFSFIKTGKGNVSFSHTNFNGNVFFMNTKFGDGELDFSNAIFGNGDLIFVGSSFNDGTVIFDHAKLDGMTFNPEASGSLSIQAKGLSVRSHAVFELTDSAYALKSFNLHSASFDGPLTLSGNLSIVPDLRATRYSHQVDLSALNVKLRRTPQSRNWFTKLSAVAEHPEDAARLRRLKEIAETNKDHQAALRFSADENRAKRWVETSWFGSVLDMTFSACSNYGQSVLRPFVALFVLAVASMGLYKKLAVTTEIAWWTGPGWGQSLLLSISNSLPFLPQSRGLREDALKALYPDDPSLWVDALMIGQGALSFVFLFLIGLGLRNRFRL